MKPLTLPPVPQVTLPTWSADVRRTWEGHTERTVALSRGAGTGRHFDQLVREARAVLLAGDLNVLVMRLRDRRFVRAVITAWFQEEPLARRTMTTWTVGAVARARPSRLATISLTSLFLAEFDRLETWEAGLFVAVRDLLRGSVRAQRVSRLRDLVEALRAYDGVLLEQHGPVRLAQGLLASGEDITAWFHANQLAGYADTRYGRIARDAYYLIAIEAADAERGEHAFLKPVTSEVLARQRTETTEEDRLRFGHQVLTALTSKTTRNPSPAWLAAVLEIGGDPRLSQTAQWQTWWSRVPTPNRERAVRWMRGADLRAFLDAVENYAEETWNDAMLRMLEARKRMLLGLYEQDRVHDVRLILGSEIRRWIGRTSGLALTDAAHLQGSGTQDTAVVYVDCGDFALVEGSHSFKLHIYTGGPMTRLSDRHSRSVDIADLRDTFPTAHLRQYGPRSHYAVAHQGRAWIHKALDYLAFHGVRVDEAGLLSRGDYADLLYRRANQGVWRWE